MDFSTAFVIQACLLFFLFFLWTLKPKTSKTKEESKKLKNHGLLDVFQLIYILLLAKPEIVAGQKVSRYTKLYKKFLSPFSKYLSKPSVIKIFGWTLFFASDYETICQINKNDAFNDRGPDGVLELYTGGKSSGIVFNNTGRGAIVLKTFLVKKLAQLGLRNKETMTSILSVQLSELLHRMEVMKLQGNNKIQVFGLFSTAVLNVIANAGFGKQFSETDDDFDYIYETFDGLCFDASSWTFYYLFSKVRGIRELFGYSHMTRIRNNTREILKNFIKERESLKVHEPENIIDFFLEEIDKQKNNENLNKVFNEEQHITVLQDLVVAGMDTTAKFLELLLMYMCLYPEVQDKVQNEIDSVLGTSGLPIYHECKSRMNYTLATFCEVHRIAHEVVIMSRMTTKDVEIAGHHLPKGTFVIPNFLLIRMDETYWKKPFDFYPEHFLDDSGVLIKEKVDRLLIFSSGARGCPGEQISNAASFTFGVGILQKYTVRKAVESEILGSLDPLRTINGPQPFHVSLYDR